MFLHETVEYCSACEELTPHSRRGLAIPKVVALAGVAAGAGLGLLVASWWASLPLLALSALIALWDRDRFWNVACERCRWKRARRARALRPTVLGNRDTVFDAG